MVQSFQYIPDATAIQCTLTGNATPSTLKVDEIQKMNNFLFEDNSSITYWRQFEIGPGKFLGPRRRGRDPSPVSVRFVDALGRKVDPRTTWSSNQNIYATSSMPFFDVDNENDPFLNYQFLYLITLYHAQHRS